MILYAKMKRIPKKRIEHFEREKGACEKNKVEFLEKNLMSLNIHGV